jgi:hypothetical protein
MPHLLKFKGAQAIGSSRCEDAYVARYCLFSLPPTNPKMRRPNTDSPARYMSDLSDYASAFFFRFSSAREGLPRFLKLNSMRSQSFSMRF